jgi:glyoxylase-like metal-dependent hydrolase (beta-lactamase superfamily II)
MLNATVKDGVEMNRDEHQLEYPWGDIQPQPGTAMQIAEGIYWIRMPLPFALDHVNVWLLRDEIDGRAGWTAVDCGIARNDVKDLWERVFTQTLDGLPVLRVMVTHMHPDHVGLAYWLCERWRAPLWMTMTDYMTACLWSARRSQAGGGPGGQAAVEHFARHGLTNPEMQQQIRQRAHYYPNFVPAMPSCYARMLHGDRIEIGGSDWRVIVGYGHAPEHASLHNADLNILISGDMVLPRISTNVSVFDYEPEANPLPRYLRSLDRYETLSANTLVLPSHGRVFKGLHVRVAQQRAHHEARLDEVLRACSERPCSASDIVPVLFKRPLDLHQLTFAMGEALAHLHALYFSGRLIRQNDPEGIVRFAAH